MGQPRNHFTLPLNPFGWGAAVELEAVFSECELERVREMLRVFCEVPNHHSSFGNIIVFPYGLEFQELQELALDLLELGLSVRSIGVKRGAVRLYVLTERGESEMNGSGIGVEGFEGGAYSLVGQGRFLAPSRDLRIWVEEVAEG